MKIDPDTREELAWLFNARPFLEHMAKTDGYEYEPSGYFNDDVDGLCHNSCVWAAIRCRQFGFDEDSLKPFFLVTGQYMFELPHLGRKPFDHSWVEFHCEENGVIVIDITLAQFEPDLEETYIGARTEFYREYERTSFADTEAIKELVSGL